MGTESSRDAVEGGLIESCDYKNWLRCYLVVHRTSSALRRREGFKKIQERKFKKGGSRERPVRVPAALHEECADAVVLFVFLLLWRIFVVSWVKA